jgi:hypothetical protein
VVPAASLVCGITVNRLPAIIFVGTGLLTPGLFATEFDATLKPFLAKHCSECHDASVSKGDFQLDQLAFNLGDAGNFAAWEKVFDKVLRGEMPPPKKERPPQAEQRPAMDWLRASLHQVSAAKQAAEGRVVVRRLNRVEYEHTLHDLLHITAPLRDLLPEDNSTHGFDNIGAALDVSSVLMERYLEAADAAIEAALWHNEIPSPTKQRYSYGDNQRLNQFFGKRMLKRDDAVVFFMDSGFYPTELQQFRAPMDGNYRFRVSAYGYQSGGKPVALGIHAGQVFSRTGETRFLGAWDAPADQPRVIEFTTRLQQGHSIRVSYHGSGYVKIEDAAAWKGPGLAVQWVEVEGPLMDGWPSASYRALFGGLKPQTSGAVAVEKGRRRPGDGGAKRFIVTSATPAADAEKLLRAFLPRAFRRPVADAEVKPFLAIINSRLQLGYTFEEAMRVGYRAVLTSPEFLFLKEKPGRLDDFALASRLSYFLWSSLPDDELLAQARAGNLSQPATLRAQTERMLKDPKAQRFTENFTGQWLELRNINSTTPDKKLYPEHNELLQLSMVRETELFFDELLRGDLPVQNFIHSEFAMLNGRLAEHYGIAGVSGQEFRKVTLPPGSHRGGVMTHASVLKVTANGTTTSPVLRGKWILERIMGIPPDPPPKNVAAVEPDIRGAKTIREQLDAHRNTEACASCHRKLDPPGFALENFDVIGGWREQYRIQPDPADRSRRADVIRVKADAQRTMTVSLGPKVDASFVTHDGKPFKDIDEFKRILLEDREQIARCVAGKLLVYATGAGLQFADRAVVEEIVANSQPKNFGLRSIVHEVVQSRAFQRK